MTPSCSLGGGDTRKPDSEERDFWGAAHMRGPFGELTPTSPLGVLLLCAPSSSATFQDRRLPHRLPEGLSSTLWIVANM